MQAVTTIGFDIAKSIFQVHGVDSVRQVIIRRQLKRRQVIVFPEAAGVPGRHRGVRLISLLTPVGRRGVEELLRVIADPKRQTAA